MVSKARRTSRASAIHLRPGSIRQVWRERVGAQNRGSAGVYQRTSITPQALPNHGGSVQQLPNFVGFTFAPRPRMTVGAALVTTNAWTQETDSELVSSGARWAAAVCVFRRLEVRAPHPGVRRRLPGRRCVALRRWTGVLDHEPAPGAECQRSHRRSHRAAVAPGRLPDVWLGVPGPRAGRCSVPTRVAMAIRWRHAHARVDPAPQRRGHARWSARRRQQFAWCVCVRSRCRLRVPPALGIPGWRRMGHRPRRNRDGPPAYTSIGAYSMLATGQPVDRVLGMPA